ncbi:hypothetical protein [Jeotgalibaca porci]|uniref:hypothetical protein n=1 Tax=Jeotgalibaca porci TaxID=1868793 RepID=UPI0035A0C3B7
MMTVKFLLESVKVPSYLHMVVRHKTRRGFDVLGGGTPSYVCRRFGQYTIDAVDLIDGVLVLWVKFLYPSGLLVKYKYDGRSDDEAFITRGLPAEESFQEFLLSHWIRGISFSHLEIEYERIPAESDLS